MRKRFRSGQRQKQLWQQNLNRLTDRNTRQRQTVGETQQPALRFETEPDVEKV